MSGNSNTHSGNGSWPAPGNYTINKADKPREGNGEWHSRTGGKHEGIDIVGKEGDRIGPSVPAG